MLYLWDHLSTTDTPVSTNASSLFCSDSTLIPSYSKLLDGRVQDVLPGTNTGAVWLQGSYPTTTQNPKGCLAVMPAEGNEVVSAPVGRPIGFLVFA